MAGGGQATRGSVSFYEELGFVRVGAVTAKKRESDADTKDDEWRPEKGKKRTAEEAGLTSEQQEEVEAIRGYKVARLREALRASDA